MASYAFDASSYSGEVPSGILTGFVDLLLHPAMQNPQAASREIPARVAI